MNTPKMVRGSWRRSDAWLLCYLHTIVIDQSTDAVHMIVLLVMMKVAMLEDVVSVRQ